MVLYLVQLKFYCLYALAFRKKVEKIAQKKGCEITGKWQKSLVNHIYWCAASTEDGNGSIIEAKWRLVANHIHNKHRGHSTLFPKCAHKRLYKKVDKAS